MDTLALGYVIPAIRAHSGLAPVRQCSCRAYQKDSLRIALEGVLLISWRLPTLPRVCSTIGVTGLNFSVRNGKRWNPGAITTRMGDMMNATLYLQTTTSLKRNAEETKPRGFYAMIYRSFLFSLIVFATRSEVRLTAYTGMILFFPLSHALPIYIIRSARQGDVPRMHTSGN